MKRISYKTAGLTVPRFFRAHVRVRSKGGPACGTILIPLTTAQARSELLSPPFIFPPPPPF